MDFASVVASVAGGNVQDEILKAKEREVSHNDLNILLNRR